MSRRRWSAFLMLVLIAMSASVGAASAAEWWQVRVADSDRDLWLEVERGRVWISGVCDGGRPAQRFERQGGRLWVELVEHERADLPGGVIEVEQRIELELVEGVGTLRLEAGGSAALVLPVTVVRRDAMPGCGAAR